jgi:putative DNA primase/helicase
LKHEIYQRGGRIVRPVLNRLAASDDRETQGWQLIAVTRPYLVETLTRAAQFQKPDRRTNGFVPTDAPDKVAETYLARHGTWNLPLLTGVTAAPFLRPDGSVCEVRGYDAVTGLLYKPECEFPPVPSEPSKDDAQKALTLIEMALLSGFPFVTSADRAVALSGILTPLDRYAMATAPLHGFSAPTAGTGKSKLVDIFSVLATGRIAPVIGQGNAEEELEKRLGAKLLAGSAIVSIDNCEHPLQSAFLSQVLTQKIVSIRLLGFSCSVETPTTSSIFCTGNNLVIAGDLTRRTLRCSLDAKCEHPEEREFDKDAVDIARARRGELVTAALTVLKAYHLSGAKGPKPLGSFETWSHRIRNPLLWLGCEDPCGTIRKVKAEDPDVMALTAVIALWCEHIGLQKEVTVQQIINHSLIANDLLVALMTVAAAKSGNVISHDRLGRWLSKNQGRIVDGMSLKWVGITHGHSIWKLVR